MKKTPKKNPAQPKIDDKPLVDDSVIKSGGDVDDAGDDADDDDDDADDGIGKGGIETGDLSKALDALDVTSKAIANGATPREAVLSAKIAAGGALTKAEREEYAALLKGDTVEEVPLVDELRKSDAMGAALDASDFLEALVGKTSEALDKLSSRMHKSQADSDAFNAQLGAGFVQMGRTIVDLAKGLASVVADLDALKKGVDLDNDQPAHAPKGNTKPVERFRKGEDGNNNEPTLSKAQVLDVMEDMMIKGEFPEGFDPSAAISKYETTQILDRPIADRIAARLKKAA